MRKTLPQLFDEFIYEAEFVRKVKPKTLKGYSTTYVLFSKIVPEASVENLNSKTVTDFFKHLQIRKRVVGKGVIKTGIKKSTVATYWSKLNVFFEWLVFHKHISINPFSFLSYPTPSYDDKQFLKKDEIEKIVTSIHLHTNNNLLLLKRNLVIFYLFIFCGIRREELLLLKIRDIDIERKILTIRGETCKTKLTRLIPLHSSVILYLKDYLTARKSYTTPYLIVSTQNDAPLSVEGLKHLVDRTKQLSGISFHLHQFRHTFAVNFLHSSRDIGKLKQLMGHKTIAMTLIYLRNLPVDTIRSDIESMSIDAFI